MFHAGFNLDAAAAEPTTNDAAAQRRENYTLQLDAHADDGHCHQVGLQRAREDVAERASVAKHPTGEHDATHPPVRAAR